MLLTVLHCAYLVSYSYQINFPGWVGGGGAGLTEIKANSASQQSWSWGLAELGNVPLTKYTIRVEIRGRDISYQMNIVFFFRKRRRPNQPSEDL